ncbi:MAG: AraC family transcriptional regulator [Flavobacteriales bacterium]
MPEVIPVHHLPDAGRATISVERIEPRDTAVLNDVHRHDFHELFVFATGTGEHMIDLEHVHVKPPCVHLVAPGQVHQLSRSADSSGAVVMFGMDVMMEPGLPTDVKGLFRATSGAQAFPIGSAQLAEVMGLVDVLEKGAVGAELAGVVRSYLNILLMKCAHWQQAAHRDTPTRADHADPVTRFTDQVDREFLMKRQVNAYASDLAISPGHLNELVKKRLGKSASEVVQDRLLLEAKRLLLHADLSVKEVSHALRMEDPAYFNRMFKKATGMTPVEYRAHIREKYQH